MATTTLAAVLDSSISERRPATMERILVIEHNSALQRILHRLFSLEGYEVDVVTLGVIGLEMLRRKPPSAVVLDLPYPESSGPELCKKIANLIPGLPLVILSASSDAAHKLSLLEVGAGDYVTIPFSPRELVRRLRALMMEASGTGPEKSYAFESACV